MFAETSDFLTETPHGLQRATGLGRRGMISSIKTDNRYGKLAASFLGMSQLASIRRTYEFYRIGSRCRF
jgi:hypothetical protein